MAMWTDTRSYCRIEQLACSIILTTRNACRQTSILHSILLCHLAKLFCWKFTTSASVSRDVTAQTELRLVNIEIESNENKVLFALSLRCIAKIIILFSLGNILCRFTTIMLTSMAHTGIYANCRRSPMITRMLLVHSFCHRQFALRHT